MVHISQCSDMLAFPWVPWQHLTSPVAVSAAPPVTEMVLKAVPRGLFPSALQATMCFPLPQGSVTARCRSRLHLPTWLSTHLGLENSLLCPSSVHRASLGLPKAFWFLIFTEGLVWGHCGGSGVSLGALGVSQPKWKCPLKQQEEKAFLCSQGQVLQAIASMIKWIGIQDLELLLGISSWVSPSRAPLVILE